MIVNFLGLSICKMDEFCTYCAWGLFIFKPWLCSNPGRDHLVRVTVDVTCDVIYCDILRGY